MKTEQQKYVSSLCILLIFLVTFFIFFLIWTRHVNFDWHFESGKVFSGGDNWEYYHDSFYRSGLTKPFDFRVLTMSQGLNSFYCPLATIAFNGLFSIFSGAALPFYIFGLILHSANALLVFITACMLTQKKLIGVLSMVIFTLNPYHVRTLSWIAAVIIHPFYVFFYLMAVIYFLKYLEGRKLPYAVSAYLAFLFSALVKISALSFIPLAMLLELLSKKKKSLEGHYIEKLSDGFQTYAMYCLTGLLLLVIAVLMYPTSSIAHEWGGITLSEFGILRFLEYLAALFFPSGPSKISVYTVLAVFYLIVSALFWGNAVIRFLVLWIIFSILLYLPSNFRPIDSLYRHFYLPAIPFSILLSYALSTLFKKLKGRFSEFYVS